MNSWVSDMDRSVGKTFIILSISDSGVILGKEDGSRISYSWPYFVLQKTDVRGELTRDYLRRQNECGLKIGDVVKITTTAKSLQDGWSNNWTSSMNFYVGSVVTITDIRENEGIKIMTKNHVSMWVPFFVLEKQNDYASRQNSAGFRAGDTVKITRAAKSYENGWGTVWLDSMDHLIRKQVRVESTNDVMGVSIRLDDTDSAYVPYFILEKVTDNSKRSKLKIGDVVTVTRIAHRGEKGWNVDWNPRMDRCVGNKYKVIDHNDGLGVRLNTSADPSLNSYNFWFPEFILKSESDFEIYDKFQVVPL
ncbi:MAG TPA: hypothetical protein PKN48_01035 [Bacteroidales bacterium]|nr:hypothetical protein [Bacteroidales bacterium]